MRWEAGRTIAFLLQCKSSCIHYQTYIRFRKKKSASVFWIIYLICNTHPIISLHLLTRRYRPGTMNRLISHKHLPVWPSTISYILITSLSHWCHHCSKILPLESHPRLVRTGQAPARSSLWKLGFSQWSKNLSTMRTTKRGSLKLRPLSTSIVSRRWCKSPTLTTVACWVIRRALNANPTPGWLRHNIFYPFGGKAKFLLIVVAVRTLYHRPWLRNNPSRSRNIPNPTNCWKLTFLFTNS